MLIGIDASRAARKIKTGTEWYSYHIIEHIMQAKSRHDFLLYTQDHLSFGPSSYWKQKKIVWPFPFLWSQGGLSLEMLFKSPDLLFVPSHAIPLIHPKKTVTTIHDVGFLEWREYRSKKDLWYLDWSTRYAVNNAAGTIVISEFTKQELVRAYQADEKKIRVVHLGVDESYKARLPEEQKGDVLKKYNLSRPFILFIGRIDTRKNVLRLVEAYEMVKRGSHGDIDLVIAGTQGFDGKEILEKIRKRGDDQIHVLGWISEHEKQALLQSARLFAFLSVYEGFGMPVIEAQTSGVPVVCSGTTSLPEVAGDAAVFCDPLDVKDIAEKVAGVLEDAVLRDDLIKRGRKNALRFSWVKAGEQTVQFFDEVFKKSR